MYKCSCYLRCLLLNKTSFAFLETFNILNIVPFKPRYITSQKHKQIPYVLFGNGTINSLFCVYVRHEVVERALNLAMYYKQGMWISPRFLLMIVQQSKNHRTYKKHRKSSLQELFTFPSYFHH